MPERSSWFTRALVLSFALLIVGLIVYNYFFTEPRGNISAGLITLVVILVVVVLSETFDKFSIGKLLSLSRETKKREAEIQNLSKENSGLRDQIVRISSSFAQTSTNTNAQTSTNTNIMALPDTILKLVNVQKATLEEVLEQEAITQQETAITESKPVRKKVSHRTFDRHKLEELAMSKYVEQNGYQNFNFIDEAKFGNYFDDLDPIAKIKNVHDGYINTGQEEIFIEVRHINDLSPILRDHLYMMLTKLNYYRSIKRANAHLALILVIMAYEESSIDSEWNIDRFLGFFTPAITSGLLKVSQITINEEEFSKISTGPS
jgi:hypothetical protein